MRIVGVCLGILLMLGGGYIVVGERLVGTSTNGTINARVLTLRAPIEGTVAFSVGTVGARLSRGERIAEIVDELFDNSRLLDLKRQLAELDAEASRVRVGIAEVEKARKALVTQADQYQTGRIAQIRARIGEAEAELSAAAVRTANAERDLMRVTELRKRGFQTVAAFDKASAVHEIALHDRQSIRQRLAFLRTELSSARKGVFLGDSYNDMPYSGQRIRDLALRLSELKAEQAKTESDRATLNRQIDAERVRIQKLTTATLEAPATGMIWDILTEEGEFVRRGQDLVRLVDCSRPLVTASVAESTYNGLSAGDTAQFRLFRDDRTFQATIVRLGGAGADQLYDNLAVAPSAQHLEQFDVTLAVPGLADQPDLECAIGRTGRLVYTEGPIALIRKVAARFGF